MQVRVSPLFFSVLTVLFLIRGDSLIMFAALGACCHEMGHIAAMLMADERPRLLAFTPFGIRMERQYGEGKNPALENLIYLAGPGINFLLAGMLALLGCREASAVNLAMGAFNLLPVGRLDGGCVLRNTAALVCRLPPYRFFTLTDAVFILPMAAAGIWLVLRQGNPTLLLTSIYLTAAAILDGS